MVPAQPPRWRRATSASAARSTRSPAAGHRPQGGGAAPALQQRHLAQDGPRADLGDLPAVLLDGQDPVEQEIQLVAGLSLLDQGLAGLKAPERRVGADDDGRQLPLQLALHGGDHRRRLLVAPGVPLAERLAVPGVEVDQPGLGLEGAVVAVDPVPGERAGPHDLEAGRPVGADLQGQGRPHHRPADLEVGAAPDPPGRGHARLATGRLGEPDHPVAGLGLPAQVGEGDAGEGQADPGQPHAGVAHVPPAQVPVAGDAAVAVDLDEGPQLVGEADGAGVEQALQVVEVVGRRQVVAGHPQLEGQLHHPLDGLSRDPRHRGHRGLDPHASSTSSVRASGYGASHDARSTAAAGRAAGSPY
jgi:hypothetical protein